MQPAPLLLACLLPTAALLACAPPPPPPPAPTTAVDPPAVTGRPARIVAIRPINPGQTGGAELILRDGSGETLAVVMPDAAGFRVGDRVVLVDDPAVRVTRLP